MAKRKPRRTKPARKGVARKTGARRRPAARKTTARRKPRRAAKPGRKPAAPRRKTAGRRRTAGSATSARGRKTTRAAGARPSTARPRRAGGTQASRKRASTRRAATKRAASAGRRTKPAGRARRPASGPRGRGPAPGLQRPRRTLEELEIDIDVDADNSPTLDSSRYVGAARTGRAELAEHLRDHTESSPDLTGGDIDADWAHAYDSGDESPGGDNPTPDQDVVDEIGHALGIDYEDAEELKSDKVTERDHHRWEYDPASSDDYDDRSEEE